MGAGGAEGVGRLQHLIAGVCGEGGIEICLCAVGLIDIGGLVAEECLFGHIGIDDEGIVRLGIVLLGLIHVGAGSEVVIHVAGDFAYDIFRYLGLHLTLLIGHRVEGESLEEVVVAREELLGHLYRVGSLGIDHGSLLTLVVGIEFDFAGHVVGVGLVGCLRILDSLLDKAAGLFNLVEFAGEFLGIVDVNFLGAH